MKAWTHLVYAAEVVPVYGPMYAVKAVKTAKKWRLAERNLAVLKYGQELTVTNIILRRKRIERRAC